MRFRVVVADPPWSFDDKLTMSDVARGSEANYPVMPVRHLADIGLLVQKVVEDDAVLALWFVAAQAQAGLNVMKAWGFRQTQIWTWEKLTKRGKKAFGLGRLARNCTEHLYVGVRGSPYKYLTDKTRRSSFEAAIGPHSQKPEALQDMLDAMFPGEAKVELFARRDRPGWVCCGLECPSTPGEVVEDSLHRLWELS